MSKAAGHIAFDLDGCLWDSDRSHFDAVNIALAAYGERITEEEHLTTFKGLPTKKKLAMLTEMGRLPAQVHEEVEHRKREATLLAIEQTLQRHEVTALLLGLRASGWRMCCCSNSIRSTVQAVLLRMGILDYMDFILSNEDVRAAKPAPEMYQKASRIFGIIPDSLVVIEDGEAGKQAARSAGCRLIAVAGPQEVNPSLVHQILVVGRSIQLAKHCECVWDRIAVPVAR